MKRLDSLNTPAIPLVDRYGRQVNYLRMSVTDRCDLRCRYCMAEEMTFLPRSEVMSLDECLRVAKVFTSLGVTKIRITGGEPLVRKDILWLLRSLKAIEQLKSLVLTTNGTQLAEYAEGLLQAGVNRLNISLDTLRSDRFKDITRIGKIEKTLHGIAVAKKLGFTIRLNVVMIRGFNDDELVDLVNFARQEKINITFIEEMPLGEVSNRQLEFFTADEACKILQDKFNLINTDLDSGGPAKYWEILGEKTLVGFISPHSHNFCHSCNRVRITAKGELYPCLGQNDAIDLLPILRKKNSNDEMIKNAIIECMGIKPLGHNFSDQFTKPQVVRFMSLTGG